MGSIPKIVSTPLKWVSKKVLNQTLLRFPGGDAHSPVACVYCPEMCRFSCPTAVVSGNDVVTPCNKMGLLYKEETWPKQAAQDQPLWPIYDCTGCGRCTEYCIYGMPVAEQLFEARKKYKWDVSEKVALELSDALDAVGDLADELGDELSALRRLDAYTHKQTSLHDAGYAVPEPRSLYFLRQKGFKGYLPWEHALGEPLGEALIQKLSGKTWLLHESVWHSRHLERAELLLHWVQAAHAKGIKIELAYAQGKDCIDCGGEGAYAKLFPSQAAEMAAEFWERDRNRAQGILCVSERCAEHFRATLGEDVLVESLVELLK
jgi:ferredoxin